MATSQRVLQDNRGHWCIENSCHYTIDWNYEEDRSRIRVGHGPENMTRLRRFAVGLLKRKIREKAKEKGTGRSKRKTSVAQKMRQLMGNTRLVLDYLCMTGNTCRRRVSLTGG